jgi:hypothetical protein
VLLLPPQGCADAQARIPSLSCHTLQVGLAIAKAYKSAENIVAVSFVPEHYSFKVRGGHARGASPAAPRLTRRLSSFLPAVSSRSRHAAHCTLSRSSSPPSAPSSPSSPISTLSQQTFPVGASYLLPVVPREAAASSVDVAPTMTNAVPFLSLPMTLLHPDRRVLPLAVSESEWPHYDTGSLGLKALKLTQAAVALQFSTAGHWQLPLLSAST